MTLSSTLSIRGLRVVVRSSGAEVVRSVDLDLRSGEILGLVGESASGKTSLALAILGYARRGLEIASGNITVGGVSVRDLGGAELRALRGSKVSYVPQDPSAALNPALTLGKHLRETLDAHEDLRSEAERSERIRETLAEVLLPADNAFLRRYPHQLSGGQQQRALLALAFLCRPALVVLDEPTTGLDVTTQAHVLATVRRLTKVHGTAAVYVTHDLAVVEALADRIAVMYSGSVVEEGATGQIFKTPRHPYTKRLIAAIPHLDGSGELAGIPGRAPSPHHRPSGCAFEPRCTLAEPACRSGLPELLTVSPGHRVRCIRADVLAAAASKPRSRLSVVAKSNRDFPLLELHRVSAWYGDVQVLHEIRLTVDAGDCLAIVGESGSGKTTLARVVAGLHRDHFSGDVLLEGTPLHRSARKRERDLRRRVQYVFQNPYSSLNPRQTVGDAIKRPLMLAGTGRATAGRRVTEMLELVSLPPHYVSVYPDQLSGGERQRVAIARALVADPHLLICDEVTSALDVSVQATIVELLRALQHELGLTLLFVTHNLPLVRSIATQVVVLRHGAVEETGSTSFLLNSPQSDYTRQLIHDTPAVRHSPASESA